MRELLCCDGGCLLGSVVVIPLHKERISMERFYGNADIDEWISDAFEDDLVNRRSMTYTVGER